VVAVNFAGDRLLHVECSLDALSAEKREARFTKKFERGRRYIKHAFPGMTVPDKPEQVAILQFASGGVQSVGGVRLVTVCELIHEIYDGLKGTSPRSKAVPSNLPLLRTLQLAQDAERGSPSGRRLPQTKEISN
jgi:hypothetical protein